MIEWHKHHIIPKHAGGTDKPSNLLKCNIAMHAFMHEQRYKEHGDWQDKIAANMLRGQISCQEATRQAQIMSNKTRTVSAETRKKMSESAKNRGVWNSGVKTGQVPVNRVRVRTPLGMFESRREAAKAHGFKYDNYVNKQINRGKEGWSYD